MNERFPGYNVLDKRNTLSWNEPTRRAIDKRLSVHPGPRYFSPEEWTTLCALCERIIPQPKERPPVPIAAYIDQKMLVNAIDGYRFSALLPQGDAWKAALAAIDDAANRQYGAAFHELRTSQKDALIRRMQNDELSGSLWRGMPSRLFFAQRVLHDVVNAYYSHPIAWNEIGWGGPASPRGYVRLDANRRDPWEAAEAYPEKEDAARAENKHVV